MPAPPDNPRAWLFRVAANLHVDRVRRARSLQLHGPQPSAAEPQTTREAAGTLLRQLAPQERVAVVLKDVFDFSLEDVAAMLASSTGAIKSALHRGREKLGDPEPEPARAPLPEAIDAFCRAFNAGDVEALAAPAGRLADPARPRYPQPEYFETVVDASPRAEIRVHRGEPIMLLFYPHRDGEAVRGIHRFELSDGKIGQLRNYFYTPDVLAEVCRELEVPFRSSGYRYWELGT